MWQDELTVHQESYLRGMFDGGEEGEWEEVRARTATRCGTSANVNRRSPSSTFFKQTNRNHHGTKLAGQCDDVYASTPSQNRKE
jgi:hypothetical protein